MNETPTRSGPRATGDQILTAGIEQARAEFARSGARGALELAFRLDSRIDAQKLPGPGLVDHEDDDLATPGGHR